MTVYPIPGTAAESALAFIHANPGCSKNAVTTHLATSPVNCARYLTKLASRGLILIETDDRGYHSVYPVA